MAEKKKSNRKAPEKVKRIVMCINDFGNGGLKIIDLKQLQVSFLLHWVVKLFQVQTLQNGPGLPKYYICFGGSGTNVFIST